MKNSTLGIVYAGLCVSLLVHAKGDNPEFSLLNKSGKKIWVDIANGGGLGGAIKDMFVSKSNAVFNKRSFDKEIDINKKTEITIYDDKDKVLYKAEFPTKKTIYITWDGKKLYPQRSSGIKGKFTGKTRQGYSLKNNVKKDEISVG